MGRISKAEAVERMKELVEEIYGALEEMEKLLEEVAPGKAEVARRYWLAHIDGALENRRGGMSRSMVTAREMIEELEADLDEDEDGGEE